MSDNFFDDLNPVDFEEAQKIQKEQEEKYKRLDHLIHRVFAQSEAGAELFKIWYDTLIMNPVVMEGTGPETWGIREGMNRFIRGIKLTINRVEKGE
jgi:hypothetical protein